MGILARAATALAGFVRSSRFLIVASLASASLAVSAQPASPKRLFSTQAPAAAPGAKAPGIHSQARPVKLDLPAMKSLRYRDEIQLALPNGRSYPVVFELAQDHGGGILSWVGHLKGRGNDARVIITTGPTGSFGSIDTPEGTFRIVPGGDHDWLVDMEQERAFLPEPPEEDDGRRIPLNALKSTVDLSQAAITTAVPGVNVVGMAKAAPSPQVVIDMMFVVTRGLANRLGAGLATRLNFLVTRANTAYADSEVAITLRMVHFTVVDYDDRLSDSTALDAITPVSSSFNAAVFGHIEGLRTTYGADMVTLLRDGAANGGSGVAWVGGSPGSASFMYSTVAGCVSGCENVWIHEVGHNMGSFHDRPTASWQANAGSRYTSTSASHAFGYAFCKSNAHTCNAFVPNGCTSQPECTNTSGVTPRDPSNFAELMAYFNASTARLYKFSNPNITCAAPSGDGVPRPCGVPLGDAQQADAAKTLNDSRLNISAFRSTVAVNLPGALQFNATGYSGTEAGGSVVFTVSRVGGSSGSVSVPYTITGATATAGTDFSAAGGTLTWADGDTANKTITVPVMSDGLSESTETFTVALGTPVGPAGVYLGYPSSAVGLILENFGGTAGGSLPSGYASSDWTVASDQANDGSTSLRSGQAFGNFGSPSHSDLTYTGVLPAGVIAFAYRVSSYQGLGVFTFSVDGTTVLSASGETGWRFFFHTLPTSGNRTLRWRFANEMPSACNAGWSPAPEGGSGCSDRVWIDSVSLPLVLVAPTVSLASSQNPSGTGQSVTFTASVSGSAGTATGTMDFRNGSTSITGCNAVALANGGASCATSALASGSHNISAVYSGNGAYVGATSSTLVQVVTSGPQLLSVNPSTLAFGGQSMNTTAPALSTTVTNTHTSSVTITAVTPPTGYAVTANTCGTLAPNATCQVTVAFTPGVEGSLNGSLLITYATGGPAVVSLTGIGEKSLVTHYYRSILRRAPDDGGKNFWNGEAVRVQALGASVNEVWFALAQQFYFSQEYINLDRDNTGFITDMYATFFNRAPDQAGLDYWVGLLNQGLPREVALVGFMLSPEFTSFTRAIFGDISVKKRIDTVVDFYRGLLARLPDAAGFNYWVEQFRLAQCSGGPAVYAQVDAISNAYVNSTEYINRDRSNTQFVSDLYNAFMRRAGDLAGVQYWISQLATNARTRDNVRREFMATPEFNARVVAMIGEGCN